MANIIVIVIVLLVGYLGVLRGFFSSLLHMVCVVLAGAIAFGVWEPVAYAILSKAPTRGFLDFFEYSAWAIGLVAPFAVSLAVLRVATDKLVPANAQAQSVADTIGAGLCGAVSGVVVAGIIIIAVGTMRFKTDQFGYEPVRYQGASLQRAGKLILPVDRMVGGLYAHTSETTFATAEPLAKWRPEPWHAAEVMRINDRGTARNTARPKDFEVMARYRVVAGSGENLLQDRWAAQPHQARMLDGDPYPSDSRIEGIILDLKSSLKEPAASFVSITEGQVWSIAESATTGERLTLHPVAVIANPKGAETSLARFPFDSSYSIASAGATVRPMAFEFVVPNGFELIAVYLKNIRRLLPPQEVTEFTVADRDSAVEQGTLIEGSEPIPEGYGEEEEEDRGGNSGRADDEADAAGIDVTNTMGRFVSLQKGNEKGLRLVPDTSAVGEGEAKWSPSEVSARVPNADLRVDKFNVDQGVVMVQVDVGPDQRGSLLGQAVAGAERLGAPVLVDTNGLRYDAVGWMYKDRDLVYIRYTPAQPLRSLQELQDNRIVLSSSREDQELRLLFLVSLGAEVKSFNIGSKEIILLEEPLKLDRPQR